MSSSPFACNANNLFASKAKGKAAVAPPEAVELIADKSQIITAIIPFGTKQAANIRKHMHENIIYEGQRIFIFRQVNGWTTISLDSTEASPKLTIDPITALKIAWREFNSCPFVNPLTIKWKGSPTVLGFDDIDLMEPQFTPLPTADVGNDNNGVNKTDGEVIYDAIDALIKKVDLLEVKLTHVVDVVDQTYYHLNKPVESTSDVGETSASAANDKGASSSTGVEVEAPSTEQHSKRKVRRVN